MLSLATASQPLPTNSWTASAKGNEVLVRWKAEVPPPEKPMAVVSVRVADSRRWYRDPAVLTPTLGFIAAVLVACLQLFGVITTGNESNTLQTVRAQVTSLQQQLTSRNTQVATDATQFQETINNLAAEAKQLGCTTEDGTGPASAETISSCLHQLKSSARSLASSSSTCGSQLARETALYHQCLGQ